MGDWVGELFELGDCWERVGLIEMGGGCIAVGKVEMEGFFKVSIFVSGETEDEGKGV